MALSVFEDKKIKPESEEIANVLGSMERLWISVKEYVAKMCGEVTEEWKFYGKSSGWTLLLKHKKRTILYLFPCHGYFIVLFVFGERAAQKAYGSTLPDAIIEKIECATPFMEGKSFQVEVKNEQDVTYIKKLIDIKFNN